MRVAVIILAAGTSARLGSPKQLVAYQGRTLLQHSIDVAQAIQPTEIVVVLGAHYALIKEQIANQERIHLLRNEWWEEGMSTSINCGIQYVKDKPCDGVIMMVCDQPFVTPGLLESLITGGGGQVAAARYGKVPGTPAFFHRDLFPALMQLKGDKGAKQLIIQHKESAVFVDFPDGLTDIDTPEDVEALHRNKVKE